MEVQYRKSHGSVSKIAPEYSVQISWLNTVDGAKVYQVNIKYSAMEWRYNLTSGVKCEKEEFDKAVAEQKNTIFSYLDIDRGGRECEECAIHFHSRSKRARFCSPKCRMASHRKKA